MISQTLKSATIAAGLALSALATNVGTAQAGGVDLFVSNGDLSFQIGQRDNRRFDRGRRGFHDDFEFRRDWRPRRCTPGRALHKARKRGLRRAHIVRVNRKGTVIAGRLWGQKVRIGYGKRPACPVRFVRHRFW